jgi:1,4-alpha-glucan branching enzyme
MSNSEAPQPSSIVGMGAIPGEHGTSFRVWAPNASSVFVGGTFNEWSGDRHPLAREEHGYWSTIVPEARAGDQYKFRIINGDLDVWRVDPYAREVTSSVGEGVIYAEDFDWEDDAYHTPGWHEMVIYELHIGTFNAAHDRLPATFDDAIEKLPYLAELGIDTIEVMPPMEFPGGISWGYNPSHLYAIESDYGGPAAFKRFVKAAHQHGMAVILDVVYNHFGPNDLNLWQFDGWSQNGMGGIYFYNDERAETPWGATRPDYGRPEVRQFIRDNALMWIEVYHVDGLRFDATANIRSLHGDGTPQDLLPEGAELLRWINSEINARQGWKLTIAEDLRNDSLVTAPVEQGGLGFDSQWAGDFVHTIRAALRVQDDASRDMGTVAATIATRDNNDAFRRVIYTESHDEVANGKMRVPEEIWPGAADSEPAKKRSTLGAALVLTAPGIPMIFQGQEFLSDSWFQDQKPLDWSRAERFPGLVQLYRDLIRLRRNWQGNTRGLSGQNIELLHINNDAKLLAFQRWQAGGAGDNVVVVANFSSQPRAGYSIGLPGPGLWRVRFNSDWKGYDQEFGDCPTVDVQAVEQGQDGQACRGELTIGAYSVAIFSQDV